MSVLNKAVAFVTDSIQSITANLGTARDKATTTEYAEVILSDDEIKRAYRGSWLARKIVDIPAHDSTREWRNWQDAGAEIELLEEEERRLGLQAKVMRAAILGRMYGVGYLYFDIAGDLDHSKPVRPGSVKKGGLRFVTVLTHLHLTPGLIDQDPLSPTAGQPLYYTTTGMAGAGQQVHPSRIVAFGGTPRPDQELLADPREDSVLVALMTAIKQFDSTVANISSLVFEANVDVIKVDGLMRIAGNPQEERKLLDRYRLAATAKGNNGVLLLDRESEDYERKSYGFTALADIMDRFAQNSSGGADIPMTRLFGRSPSGMNSTGESDLRNYYDNIKADQNLKLRPALAILDECLIHSALGKRPKELHYTWRSLWQVTDKERSDLGAATVGMIKSMKETGLFPDEVLADTAVNSLTEHGALPGLESLYNEYFEEGGEAPYAQEPEVPEGGEGGPGGEGTPPPRGGRSFGDDFSEQPRAPKGAPNGGQWVGKAGFKQNPIPLSNYTQDKGNFEWALRDIERQIDESDDHEEFVKAVSPSVLTTTQDYLAESGRGDAQGGVFPDLGDDYGDDYPVVAVIKETGEHLLIDGNHRMARALIEYPKDKVYAWVFEVSLPKKSVADDMSGQPRAPKGSPNGGQWVKGGAGGGSASDKAAAKVASAKYSADKVKGLLSKEKGELSHYEKKVLAKYKAALQEEQQASAPKPAAPAKAPPKVAPVKESAPAKVAPAKAAALASVATPSYPAEKIEGLLSKNKEDLTHYEKKKLAAYKKALSEGAPSPAPSLGKKPKHAMTNAAAMAIKKASGAPSSMSDDTVAKLASGEWKPDPTKPWQAKVAAHGGTFMATGKAPSTVSSNLAGAFVGGGSKGPSLAGSLADAPPPISSMAVPQTKLAAIKSSLTGAETKAAQSYTGSTYHDINGALRKGSTHYLVPQLDAAIAKTAAAEKMVVVRGISQGGMNSWLQAGGGQLKVGSVITDKGFVSTTRNPSVASNFAGGGTGYGLKINVPKGSKILPLKSISHYAQEDEFLLPHGSSFKIKAYDPATKVITVDLVKN